MPVEIINTLRSSSIIRATDAGTYTITLANLSANASMETINSASIKKALWSTNGNITVVRNSVPQFSLHNCGEMRFSDMGYSVANNSTAPIVITITTGGSIFIEVTKDATFNPVIVG